MKFDNENLQKELQKLSDMKLLDESTDAGLKALRNTFNELNENHPDFKYIQAIRNNDNLLITELYHNVKPAVKKYILANNGDINDVNDVMQDALTRIYKFIEKPNFRLTTKFESFLLGFVRRIWLKELKKRKGKVTFDNMEAYKVEDILQKHDNTDAEIMKNQFRKILEENLLILDERCRKILLLSSDKTTMEDIAQEMGFANANSARQAKHKCLKKVIRIIKNDSEFRSLLD